MEEISIRYEKMKWTDAPGYPEGSKIKILREGGPGGGKIFLRKIKRGFKMEGHSHATVEQHFVLQGQYESEGKIYRAGTYRLIPRHKTHGLFKSSTGAVILVIWDPEQKDLAEDLEKMKRTAQRLTKKEKLEFLRDVVPVVCKGLSDQDKRADILDEAWPLSKSI